MLTKIKATTMGLGSRTMAFFRRGEELEATEFKTLPYDDPILVPPKVEFRGFDKIPRRRAPLVITFVLIAAATLIVFGLRSPGEWVRLKTFVGAKLSAPSTPR